MVNRRIEGMPRSAAGETAALGDSTSAMRQRRSRKSGREKEVLRRESLVSRYRRVYLGHGIYACAPQIYDHGSKPASPAVKLQYERSPQTLAAQATLIAPVFCFSRWSCVLGEPPASRDGGLRKEHTIFRFMQFEHG